MEFESTFEPFTLLPGDRATITDTVVVDTETGEVEQVEVTRVKLDPAEHATRDLPVVAPADLG